jgi:hypothetical protein
MRFIYSIVCKVIATLAMMMLMSFSHACDITLSSGNNQIQAALNTPGTHSVCLSPGVYYEASGLTVNAGQLLIGTGNTDDAILVSSAQYPVQLLANATVARMNIEGAWGFLPDYGVIVGAVSGAAAWGLRIRKVNIGLGANGASNVAFSSNWITQNGTSGDGIAQPSI